MASTDIQGFILWAAGLTQSDIILNDLLLKLDRRLNLHVLSRAELGPPGGDSDGDIYIMPSGTLTGAWSGFSEHDVVLLRGGTWYAEAPIAGLGAYVADEDVGIIFTGSAWTETLIAGAIADSDFPAEGLMRAVDGAGDYASIKTNLMALDDPTVDDDVTAGYSEFSPWISHAASDPVLWICLDPAAGEALWQPIGSGSAAESDSGAGLNQSQVDARVVVVSDALYRPAMMRFYGSSYYSANCTTSGDQAMGLATFKYPDFSGGGVSRILTLRGSNGFPRIIIQAFSTDFADADRAGKIMVATNDLANVTKCLLFSKSIIDPDDDTEHSVYYEFDGSVGAVVFEIDGIDADDTGNPDRIAPTSGTLDDGAGIIAVGADTDGSKQFIGNIGFCGIADAFGLTPSDFFDGKRPKDIDPASAFGGTPRYFNPHGQMTNNIGSEPDMTKNGVIEMCLSNFGNGPGLIID